MEHRAEWIAIAVGMGCILLLFLHWFRVGRKEELVIIFFSGEKCCVTIMNNDFVEGDNQMGSILVVDDEVPILELIKNGLQKDGHMVTVCSSAGQISLETLNRYDMILLDVMMPEMDGFSFCEKIRGLVDCPILFLTAKTMENDITYGLGIGADDYLTKPFRISELRARVNAHLRREKRET